MILAPALCYLFFSVAKAQPEQEPCRNIIQCQNEYSDRIYEFCSDGLPAIEGYSNHSSEDEYVSRVIFHVACPGQTDVCLSALTVARLTSDTERIRYDFHSNGFILFMLLLFDCKVQSVDCPDPGFVSNAVRHTVDGNISMTPQTFQERESVIYSCESAEFALQGIAVLTCTSHGTWTSPLPRCTRSTNCRDPGQLTNGDRFNTNGSVSNTTQRYEVGQSVIYTCHEGFALLSYSLITCMEDGKWSERRPHCISVNPVVTTEPPAEDIEDAVGFCQDPGVDPNGKRTPRKPLLSKGFLQGSRIEYSCKEGYFLKGEEELFCLNTETWSSEAPTCEPEIVDITFCISPGPISKGKVSPKKFENEEWQETETDLQYLVGTRLDYTCDTDYVLEGNSSLACEKYGVWSSEPPNCFPRCGLSQTDDAMNKTTFITELKDPAEWPWAIAVSSKNNIRVQCNAILLNRNTALTAAGCIRTFKIVYLYFGRGLRNVTGEAIDLAVRVSTKIIVHPNYKPDPNIYDFENDIALIKFAPSVIYTEKIVPICLPTKESTEKNLVPGNVGYVGGFGKTSFKETDTDKRLFGPYPVKRDEDCDYSIGPITFRPTKTHFCAGHRAAPWSACVDSGAAFAFFDKENRTFVLEGVVSKSLCRYLGSPARILMLTKVQPFLPWIYENFQEPEEFY